MNCPVCDAKLRPVDKHGVEADVCPDCKGIWLDRGELEKIIEAVAGGVAPQGQSGRVECEQRDHRGYDDHEHDRGHGSERESGDNRPRRRGSWLSDIMESLGGGD